MSTSFPSRPWERVGMDLFDFRRKVYILVVDYYSCWLNMRLLKSQTSKVVIKVLKSFLEFFYFLFSICKKLQHSILGFMSPVFRNVSPSNRSNLVVLTLRC